jgi:thymidylate synthase
VIYSSVAKRTPDSQYRDLLQGIMETGVQGPTRQGVDVLTSLWSPKMVFPFENGFPIINDRSVKGFWKKPINELGAMMNGVRTIEGFKAAGCDWWVDWTTPEKCIKYGLVPGDIGPGSYGAAFHDFPMPDGGTFDQFGNIVQQIRDYPDERRHVVTPWIPYYTARTKDRLPKVTIAPCHGWVYVRILNNRLYLTMNQRSGDVPVGVPSNMIQYAALAIFLGHITGYEPAMYVHNIWDAHIYVDQIPFVEQIVEREAKPLATLVLNKQGLAATDVHQFSGDLFELQDYDPHPGIRGIPVAA